MSSDESLKAFHDRIFDEMHDLERAAKREATEQLVKLAGSVGYSIDDLLRMCESGMNGPAIFDLIKKRLFRS